MSRVDLTPMRWLQPKVIMRVSSSHPVDDRRLDGGGADIDADGARGIRLQRRGGHWLRHGARSAASPVTSDGERGVSLEGRGVWLDGKETQHESHA
jgi:hypothetical protein